jgi:hypothetical protein
MQRKIYLQYLDRLDHADHYLLYRYERGVDYYSNPLGPLRSQEKEKKSGRVPLNLRQHFLLARKVRKDKPYNRAAAALCGKNCRLQLCLANLSPLLFPSSQPSDSHNLITSIKMAEEIYDGAIGIDLGTTYSCVANYEGTNVEIIANEQGSFTTPSFVSFTEKERLIGESAKNQAAMNPRNTIFDIKSVSPYYAIASSTRVFCGILSLTSTTGV